MKTDLLVENLIAIVFVAVRSYFRFQTKYRDHEYGS